LNLKFRARSLVDAHDFDMKSLPLFSCCSLTLLMQAMVSSATVAEDLASAPRSGSAERIERICLSATSTREQATAHKLVQPFQIIQRESRQRGAEAIGARLCRWNEQLVYEINLLRQDGRVIHVYFNATDGAEIADAR